MESENKTIPAKKVTCTVNCMARKYKTDFSERDCIKCKEYKPNLESVKIAELLGIPTDGLISSK